ncbi:MAG TPA: diguanylate cyclase [Steroidobacteraceae bacterium]|jgi:diguanylate cyclase (GGDEF)-like protein
MLVPWLLCLTACLWTAVAAAAPVEPAFEIQSLAAAVPDPTTDAVLEGLLDSRFEAFNFRDARRRGGPFWLKLRAVTDFSPAGVPVVSVHKGRHLDVRLFAAHEGKSVPLGLATELPGFRGAQDSFFVLPEGIKAGQALYAYVKPQGDGSEELHFSTAVLDQALARATDHARMIALAFGALMAMALAALLIWFVLSDKLLLLYATLFSLQALYVSYLSGQGFDWPLLSYALPVASYAWNVTAALSGAVACLFVREIADLKRFSPRVFAVFGWFAAAFTVLSVANLAEVIGLGGVVAAIGNVVFVSAAIFTLVVAFLAWRRNSRAAGWFLIAWGLLEAFTIATSVRLLFTDAEDAAGLLYYGLPLSMVAAAVLIALGVADRQREQRLALTDAQRRAQIDPLTGVLNRRSLVERLDAAGFRARARGLPIALLFIDLDHFKQINDTAGHAAGDACLRAIIEPIQAELRQSDVIGRYGGEEFVVILSSADLSAAEPIAERIRERVADVRVEGFGNPIHVTCSIGVATSDMLGVWGEHLIARADEAVYAAKRSGRNRVKIAAPLAA